MNAIFGLVLALAWSFLLWWGLFVFGSWILSSPEALVKGLAGVLLVLGSALILRALLEVDRRG